MYLGKISKKATISFLICIAIFIKDILVSYLNLIPERGVLNRVLSWGLILPLSIVAIIFSLLALKSYYKKMKDGWTKIEIINFILCIPGFLLFLYAVFSIVELILEAIS